MATAIEDKELTVPNPAQMQGEIKQFLTAKEALVAKTMAMTVTDDESCLVANDFLTSTLVPLRRDMEKKRQEYATTLRRIAAAWDKEFRPTIDAVDGLITYLKECIKSFTLELEERARKLQEELDRKAEEERKAAEAWGESPQIPEQITELAPAVSRTTHTNGGTSTVKKVPYLEIFDEAKLPRKYLIPNKTLIWEDVKAGIKVPGAKLSYREEVAIRTK